MDSFINKPVLWLADALEKNGWEYVEYGGDYRWKWINYELQQEIICFTGFNDGIDDGTLAEKVHRLEISAL